MGVGQTNSLWLKSFGLDLIEFIFDYNGAEDNPLLRADGCAKISSLSNQTGVFVETICADYFMEAPLHSEDMTVVQTSIDILNRLIESANRLQIRDIVLPCVDQSSLKARASMRIVWLMSSTALIPDITKRRSEHLFRDRFVSSSVSFITGQASV